MCAVNKQLKVKNRRWYPYCALLVKLVIFVDRGPFDVVTDADHNQLDSIYSVLFAPTFFNSEKNNWKIFFQRVKKHNELKAPGSSAQLFSSSRTFFSLNCSLSTIFARLGPKFSICDFVAKVISFRSFTMKQVWAWDEFLAARTCSITSCGKCGAKMTKS